MKKLKIIAIIFCFVLIFCQLSKAANDDGWKEYAPNSFINTGVKNIAINPSMMQISYYSKMTNLNKTINSQPVDTLVQLSIADCSGIVKTKDVSQIYYNGDTLVTRLNFDKSRSWEYHSPDSVYYQTLKTICSNTFKVLPRVIKETKDKE